MSKGLAYRYRYLYQGQSVKLVFLESVNFQIGKFLDPFGDVVIRHFSSFIMD